MWHLYEVFLWGPASACSETEEELIGPLSIRLDLDKYEEVGIMDSNLLGMIIAVLFIIGSFFHLRMRRKHLISCHVKSVLKLTLIIVIVVFMLMAHFLRGEPLDYLIALSASGFIFSSILSQGISGKGVCYFTGATFILSTAPWKNIQKAVISEGEILGIEFSGKTLRFNQTYKKKDRDKVMDILRDKNLMLEKEE